jgi:Flp pilus assembly protein TadG
MRLSSTKSMRGFWRSGDGVSAIEFAIIAPVFFTLVLGIMVYGYYFAALNLVDHIAYEAARASITGLSDAERSALAHARAEALIGTLGGLIDPTAIEVDAAPSATAGLYAITVRYHFELLEQLHVSAFLPLPPVDHAVKVEISHGGY